jgi:hypothetical protein
MSTAPIPLHALAAEPGFTVAELDSATTLTLRGHQLAPVRGESVPSELPAGSESTGRCAAAPASLTITF